MALSGAPAEDPSFKIRISLRHKALNVEIGTVLQTSYFTVGEDASA